MKKYISILSLLTVLILQSCEIIDDGADTENPEKPLKKDFLRATEKQSSDDDASTVFSKESNEDNLDTGDDDEPRKDKQHWRAVRDYLQTGNKEYDNNER